MFVFGAPTLNKNAQELFLHTSILNFKFFSRKCFFKWTCKFWHKNFQQANYSKSKQFDVGKEQKKHTTTSLVSINPCNEFSLGIVFVTSVVVLLIIIKAASHTMLFIEMIADIRCMALSIPFSMVAIICWCWHEIQLTLIRWCLILIIGRH